MTACERIRAARIDAGDKVNAIDLRQGDLIALCHMPRRIVTAPKWFMGYMQFETVNPANPDSRIGKWQVRADTTVALGRRIMGKPADADEAAQFLHALSGRRHKVITALAVKRGGRIWQKDVQTTVAMKRLSDSDINWYLGTNDWQGKAGGYGIQGPASAFVTWLNGSFHAVMGLPLPETVGLLTAAGYPILGGAA